MIVLKKEPKEKLTPISVQIPPRDKEILKKIGNGQLAEGLRIILFSFREDLLELIKQREESGKKKKAS